MKQATKPTLIKLLAAPLSAGIALLSPGLGLGRAAAQTRSLRLAPVEVPVSPSAVPDAPRLDRPAFETLPPALPGLAAPTALNVRRAENSPSSAPRADAASPTPGLPSLSSLVAPEPRPEEPVESSSVQAAGVFDGLKARGLPSASTPPVPAAPTAATAPGLARFAVKAKRWLARAALLAAPSLAQGSSCLNSSCDSTQHVAAQAWVHPNGKIRVEVNAEPFSLTVKDASGNILLESASPHGGAYDGDPLQAYAPLAVDRDRDLGIPTPDQGWDTYLGLSDPWTQSGSVTSFESAGGALIAHVATGAGGVTLRIEAQGPGVRLLATVDDPTSSLNRVSLGFRLHDDPGGDHFLGLGERYVYSDHRGQAATNWVEEDGIGLGERVPPNPLNPFPNGPEQTHIPIPWVLSPRGFGLLLNGTFRTVHHLGDEASDAWRVESWRSTLDATLFVDPDPLALVENLTALTGRPPEFPDWVLAPRRRVNPGTDEAEKLRAAHVPTSVLDLDVHYFPNGGGADSAAMKALTADAHAKGFKAVAYFNPFLYDTWHPVFDEAAAKGYLVKHPDGSPYVVLDYPNNAAMVDFTNPDAVIWYQSWLQRALDDGWDGWMYDFGEYVPRDAVMFNGMRGDEAHNLYPVLYQQAAFDLLQKQRPASYLIFARSGFLGTGGKVPMVWAGDQETDFDPTDGLPAALTGALNAGMSGIPLWGSDISGYHYILNPPPDKEVYLRWTELGAFSADMHDENEGQGAPWYNPADRWKIWSDQETLDAYRNYASWKTRMLPYVKLAARQARQRGTPVMRHLYLNYPRDPNVYGIKDEYMYGDSLLVAPVVTRGANARPVYLPEPAYFDFWSGKRVAGGGTITVAAPLTAVPVFAKPGAIVPLLSPDVETVVPSLDGSVVSSADRADFLEVAVFAGGKTSVTLDDGTTLSQTAPPGPFSPSAPSWSKGAIPAASSEADLMACAACYWDDAANNVWKVTVMTSGDTVAAGPLTLTVGGAPSIKRFLFSVRH